jgi:Asp-tRNA(Asn)/Glu-tRNA(Gln) amidotransferase C subunit
MTLDVLSSIKGAKASDAVNELFKVIKNAHSGEEEESLLDEKISNVVNLEDLREDKVINSTDEEKALIKENFPKEKNGYLLVQKVIEE